MNAVAMPKWKRRWTMKKEVKVLEGELKTLKTKDDQYAAHLSSIEQMTRIRNSKIETGVKVLKNVGMLAICGAVALVAYSVDKSDAIPRNKTTMNLFNRIFRF